MILYYDLSVNENVRTELSADASPHIILLNTSEIKPFEEQNNYLTKLFELFLNQNCIFLRGKSLLKTGSCKEKPPASVTLNT